MPLDPSVLRADDAVARRHEPLGLIESLDSTDAAGKQKIAGGNAAALLRIGPVPTA